MHTNMRIPTSVTGASVMDDHIDDNGIGKEDSHNLPAFQSKECCKLTQSTMDKIIQRVNDLNQYIISQISLAVTGVITEAGLDVGDFPKLKDIFDLNGSFGRPFKGIEQK